MKKLLVAVLINLFVVAARSQGIVYFANVDGTDVNAPVYESDGVTKVSGPQYMAQLLGGPSASSMVSIASTSFLTGAGAGYFLGGNQTIPDVFPGNVAWVEVLGMVPRVRHLTKPRHQVCLTPGGTPLCFQYERHSSTELQLKFP